MSGRGNGSRASLLSSFFAENRHRSHQSSTMVYTRLSLRAAALFTVIAIAEVSAHDVAPKKHRKRGRCQHSISSSVLSATTTTDSILPTASSASSSAIEIIVSSTLTSSVISTSSSSVPSSTVGPTSTSSPVITTTSDPPYEATCEATIATWAPEVCWRSIPARCTSMTAVAAPTTISLHASACTSALIAYSSQVVPEVSGCFANLGQAAFDPASAFSCVSAAPIYCQSTSACPPAATATSNPIIPAYDNSGFEKGDLGNWHQINPATPGNLLTTVSTDQAHTGSYSLKLTYNNLADDSTGWVHRVKFEPGGRYEFSFWYFSTSNLSRGTLSLQVQYPGQALQLVVSMTSQPTGRWIQQKFSLTPSTSFGTLSVTYQATKTAPMIVYLDDITLTRTA
ncbi:hypothetical protein B0H66DRAFT_568108 [Apodospora peruviana]|uniref:MAM domain-containing protein n=1 Tax=Apodospora peruviana TaxID=516989 RepID=A0AAE0M0D1_9PEZI|nr:hypothetical protein B0H66DRAFT_568108 [Apodospora peruviana]